MRILSLVIYTIATGYLIALCFAGMNAKSDLTYLGGMLALAVWFFVVTPIVYQKLWRGKLHEQAKQIKLAMARFNARGSDRLHNTDRTGNGGDRS